MNNQLVKFVLASAVAVPLSTLAAEPASMSVEDISACMRGNIVDRGSLRDFEITAFDREGKSTALKVKLFWKPTKDGSDERMTLQVAEPETFAGTSYLVVANPDNQEVYMYLPALKRTQSVTGGDVTQTLWGTDFTFADVKQVQGVLLDGETTRLADVTVFDRKAYLLDTVTNPEQSGYSHVKTYVDQTSCTLLKTELFSGDDTPVKVLEADISTLLEVTPYWLMLGYKMSDTSKGTHTDLKLSDIYLKENLPESLFTPEGFFNIQE